ncbi:aminoglycoside 6'-N-acetyltransferase [Undibacterium sp. Di27W]|uniref:aminoglycoside 6'-N-acetyltransferase n=1 Tax=Undibacterium sp. Di27W TaxID=3413036 RepID=UPI003BEFD578
MAVPCKYIDQIAWLELRQQLWPENTREAHLLEMTELLQSPDRFAQFIEYDAAGLALGVIEVSLRGDYVNGADSSPVAFLEGLFVIPQARKRGISRILVAEAELWAKCIGASEFASDALLENTVSHDMHAALGFVETERVVYFKKSLLDVKS